MAGSPIIIVYFIAIWLPESPRWLLQRSRVQEVKSLVERLEREAGLEHDSTLLDPGIMKSLAAQGPEQKSSIRSVFKSPYLSRMLISGGVYGAWFIFWYIILVYGPVIFSDKGFRMGSAVMFAGAMTFIGGAAQCSSAPLRTDMEGNRSFLSVRLSLPSDVLHGRSAFDINSCWASVGDLYCRHWIVSDWEGLHRGAIAYVPPGRGWGWARL